MFEYQYLVGGVLSLLVSVYVLIKRPNTSALRLLFVFGLVVSVWEVSSFFSKTAPNAFTAAELYRVTLLTSHLCFPVYLATVLNVREQRSMRFHFLVFFPVIVQMTAMFHPDYFASYQFSREQFGWVYTVVSYRLPLIVSSVIFLGYLLGITIVLLSLSRTTSVPLLRKKYIISLPE